MVARNSSFRTLAWRSSSNSRALAKDASQVGNAAQGAFLLGGEGFVPAPVIRRLNPDECPPPPQGGVERPGDPVLLVGQGGEREVAHGRHVQEHDLTLLELGQ